MAAVLVPGNWAFYICIYVVCQLSAVVDFSFVLSWPAWWLQLDDGSVVLSISENAPSFAASRLLRAFVVWLVHLALTSTRRPTYSDVISSCRRSSSDLKNRQITCTDYWYIFCRSSAARPAEPASVQQHRRRWSCTSCCGVTWFVEVVFDQSWRHLSIGGTASVQIWLSL